MQCSKPITIYRVLKYIRTKGNFNFLDPTFLRTNRLNLIWSYGGKINLATIFTTVIFISTKKLEVLLKLKIWVSVVKAWRWKLKLSVRFCYCCFTVNDIFKLITICQKKATSSMSQCTHSFRGRESIFNKYFKLHPQAPVVSFRRWSFEMGLSALQKYELLPFVEWSGEICFFACPQNVGRL